MTHEQVGTDYEKDQKDNLDTDSSLDSAQMRWRRRQNQEQWRVGPVCKTASTPLAGLLTSRRPKPYAVAVWRSRRCWGYEKLHVAGRARAK